MLKTFDANLDCGFEKETQNIIELVTRPDIISQKHRCGSDFEELARHVFGRRCRHAIPGVQELHPPRPGRKKLSGGGWERGQNIRLWNVS